MDFYIGNGTDLFPFTNELISLRLGEEISGQPLQS